MDTRNQLNDTIYNAALTYARRGYAVIPVQNKLPRVPVWTPFQEKAPAEAFLQDWHNKGLFSEGIAIITGEVSNRLLVLDFDDMNKAAEFEEIFPSLAKTSKVMTRRGFHYHYKLHRDAAARSQKLKDIDVQWNGRYVVAPPTPGYKSLNRLPRRVLTQAEYNAIIHYFSPDEPPTAQSAVLGQYSLRINPTPQITVQTIISTYLEKKESGRNDALFFAVRFARDNGLTADELKFRGLQDAFVYSVHPSGKHESERTRMKEYERTVKSVYKRAPSMQQLINKNQHQALSDDARQKLHENGQSNTSRVFDALSPLIEAGTKFTRKEAYKLTKGIIDWKRVNQALNAIFGGQTVFKKLSPSPHPNPSLANADEMNQNNAYFHRKKAEKIKIGRKPTLFVMPSADDLQRITGAKFWTSTPITADDLKSVRNYRARLNKGRIERTQRYEYHYQGWLAECLGVTARTIRNYIQHSELYAQERLFHVLDLNLGNVDELLDKDFILYALRDSIKEVGKDLNKLRYACFMITESGIRYRLSHRVALFWLRKGKRVTIVRRASNHYSTSQKSLQSQLKELNRKPLTGDWSELITRYRNNDDLGAIAHHEIANPTLAASSAAYWQTFKKPAASSDTRPKPELTPDERLYQLYQQTSATIANLRETSMSDDEREVREVFAAMDFNIAYRQQETWNGIQGISEPSAAAIERRRRDNAHEEAYALIQLLPKGHRQLSQANAVKLILELGADKCQQVAKQINIQTQIKKDVKNPVGLLIARLRGTDKKHATRTTRKQAIGG